MILTVIRSCDVGNIDVFLCLFVFAARRIAGLASSQQLYLVPLLMYKL